jgi:MoxR-like ATPase
VIATQNPVDLSGTFPLPDSQMDRFLLRLSMGYPDAEAERAMLAGRDRRLMINETMPRLGADDVLALQRAVDGVHASDALLDYVQRLLVESRRHAGVRVGLSPRAGLALLRGARAHALLLGRAHALPDDVQALFASVAAHRLVADAEGDRRDALAASILGAVAVD